MHVAEEASKIWRGLTGCWPGGWWHTSVASPVLWKLNTLKKKKKERKLNMSLSGFCPRHGKNEWVGEGCETSHLPSPLLNPVSQDFLTQIEFGNLGFLQSACSLLLHFSPSVHLPASGPLHLLFCLPGSWRDFLCSSEVSSSKRHPPSVLPTPVLLLGESHGQRNLAGYSP